MEEKMGPNEMTAADLAAAIDEFSYEYDQYGYRDAIDDREAAIDKLTARIEQGDAFSIKAWLLAIVRENDEHSGKGQQLLDQFERYETQRLEYSFLSNSVDAFAIYQLKDGDELHDIRFEPLSWLQSIGRAVERDNYNLVYTAPLTDPGGTPEKLDALWYRFNNERPRDFYGHSLSVSDIVALKQDGNISCYYVDSFGFQELPGFYSGEASPRQETENTDKCKLVMERLAAQSVRPEKDGDTLSHNTEIER